MRLSDDIEDQLAIDGWLDRNGIRNMDDRLNHIESDLRYQEARREGSGRGGLNLGTQGGYPIVNPHCAPERSSWWLVAAGVVLAGLALYGLRFV